jgi:O-antigen/teichoic acid export membrane protein
MSKQSGLPPMAVIEDMTGLDRLARNVFVSWAGYIVVIIAGFIMPRMIDRQIGQEALGIWDFCWSVVSYFGFAGIGVGSSVNRYVARYRALGELEVMNRALSSVNYVQTMIALAMFVVTGLIFWFLPILFSNRLGAETGTAAYVVGFLGASLAVQMAFDAFRGVITGCHRWDLHNLINSASHVLTVMGMLTVLSLGSGLIGISMFYFFGTVMTEIVRLRVAKSVCPELKIKFALATRTQALEMITFGGKTFLIDISPMLLLQTSNVLIAAHLGPATLALFARPSSLVRNAQTFLNKFAFVLTPTAGSLQGHGRHDEIRRLFLQSTQFSVAITLPMVIILTVFGDEILRIWMGPRYEQGIILFILAIGYFLPISQQSAYTMMAGLNRHGRMGLVIFGIALCGIGLSAGIAT